MMSSSSSMRRPLRNNKNNGALLFLACLLISLSAVSLGVVGAEDGDQQQQQQLLLEAVLSTNPFPSSSSVKSSMSSNLPLGSSSWETRNEVVGDDDESFEYDELGFDWLTDNGDDGTFEEEDEEVRGFEKTEEGVDGYEWLGEEGEETEEEEEEEEEEYNGEYEDEDEFHPTYWEVAGVMDEDQQDSTPIEYPPLPLLRGKEADEHEMWASFPTFFKSTETYVTYVIPNDIRPHIESVVRREILKALYLGLTMFVLVVFVLDTFCGGVFNESSPNTERELERNFDRDEERGHWEKLHDRFEQPLYFDTEYKTFREFPNAKQAATQTSTVSRVV
jgi:hypothetical protein